MGDMQVPTIRRVRTREKRSAGRVHVFEIDQNRLRQYCPLVTVAII